MSYKIKVTYSIDLDSETIYWLKSVLQNPLFDCTPEDEDSEDRKQRLSVWETLPSFEELVENKK